MHIRSKDNSQIGQLNITKARLEAQENTYHGLEACNKMAILAEMAPVSASQRKVQLNTCETASHILIWQELDKTLK